MSRNARDYEKPSYRVRVLRAPTRALARKKARNWTEPESIVYFISAGSPHEKRTENPSEEARVERTLTLIEQLILTHVEEESDFLCPHLHLILKFEIIV